MPSQNDQCAFVVIKMVIIHMITLFPDADGISTTATLEVHLWETNDYPPVLIPLSGTVCSDRDRDKLGLLLSAVDEDMSPQADPFTFYITDQNVAANWTIITLNGKTLDIHVIVISLYPAKNQLRYRKYESPCWSWLIWVLVWCRYTWCTRIAIVSWLSQLTAWFSGGTGQSRLILINQVRLG